MSLEMAICQDFAYAEVGRGGFCARPERNQLGNPTRSSATAAAAGCGKLREPEGYRRPHPVVRIDTLVGGSGAAGPALTEGWADFAFNARELLPKEEPAGATTS